MRQPVLIETETKWIFAFKICGARPSPSCEHCLALARIAREKEEQLQRELENNGNPIY